MLLLVLGCYCKIDFIFRSLANGHSCMYSSISRLLVGNNSFFWISWIISKRLVCKHMKINTMTLHENENAAAFNHIKSIYYHILLTHQLLIICIMKTFQIDLLYISFRSKEDCPCHWDERNHYCFFFLSWNLVTWWWRKLTKQSFI